MFLIVRNHFIACMFVMAHGVVLIVYGRVWLSMARLVFVMVNDGYITCFSWFLCAFIACFVLCAVILHNVFFVHLVFVNVSQGLWPGGVRQVSVAYGLH